MKTKSVVLLSAGLDSSYNLWRAQRETEVLLVLTFAYGQRAQIREVERSERLALRLGLKHQVVELPWFALFSESALVDHTQDLPQGSEVSLSDMERAHKTAQQVWVPNRNGIFLNIAAGFAEGLGADQVVVGFNREEAQTFPDNSQDFIIAMDHSLSYSTASKVKIQCYSTQMDKTEIATGAKALGLPLADLWPCYLGGEEICRQCESCQRFLRAVGEEI